MQHEESTGMTQADAPRPPPTVRPEIEDRREAAGRGLAPRRVHAGVLLFYVLALLLNAEALHERARLLPFGRGRDLAVAVSRPVDRLARALRLHHPRRWIERQVHGAEALGAD